MRALGSVGLGLLVWAAFGLYFSYEGGKLWIEQRESSRRLQAETLADHAAYAALLREQGLQAPAEEPQADPWAEHLDTWAAELPEFHLLVWIALTLPPAGLALWRMLKALRTARQIEDLPTSTLRGAAQGFVELHGRAAALPLETSLQAPLSGNDCVWWACKVFRERGFGDKKRWEMTRDETSSQAFVVDDATGLGLVLPAGADAESVQWTRWQPDSMTRYVEGLIRAGDELYVLGEMRTLRAPWSQAPGDTAALLPEIEAMSLRRFPDNPAPGVNLVARPGDGRAFILATESQRSLVSGERWAAAICLLLFVCLSPAAAVALVGAWGRIVTYYLP